MLEADTSGQFASYLRALLSHVLCSGPIHVLRLSTFLPTGHRGNAAFEPGGRLHYVGLRAYWVGLTRRIQAVSRCDL